MFNAIKTIFDSLIGIEGHSNPVGIAQIRAMSNEDLLNNVLNTPVQTGKIRPMHIKPVATNIQQQNPFGRAVFSPFNK